jgi:hypothetical protein
MLTVKVQGFSESGGMACSSQILQRRIELRHNLHAQRNRTVPNVHSFVVE